MSIRSLGAAAVVVMLCAAAGQATAADLSGYEPPYRTGHADEDPRYSDMYRHPAPPAPRYAEPRRDYYPPPQHQQYLPPMRPPPAAYSPPAAYWGERRPYAERSYGRNCVPRHLVMQDLERRGWYDFQQPELRGEFAHVRARRGSGHVFDLTIERCSGSVLEARLVQRYVAQAPDWRYRDGYRQY